MKIGVNCLTLNDEYAGLGIYAVNLLNHLAKVTGHEFYIFCAHPDIVRGLLSDSFSIEEVRMKNTRLSRVFAEQVTIPIRARTLGLDVMFTPAFYMPLFTNCYSLVTIHDLIHKAYPSDVSLKTQLIMSLFLDQSIKRADRIITVSDCTRKDISKYLGRTEGIDVIHEGLGNLISNKQVKPDYMEDTERFALIVGSMMPRKNILGMLEAYHSLKDRNGLKLVIVGHKGDAWPNIQKYVMDHNLSSEVTIGGYISDEELNWLYAHARMLLYCSFYEGFGFPPLEAMRNGVPVVASNRSSIPEIVGDAAWLVEPESITQISMAIARLDSNEQTRNQLIAAGRQRVQLFSWEKTARQTEHILSQIEEELSR
jgi:glycosyltransferase involved in cell wall biosynthesis